MHTTKSRNVLPKPFRLHWGLAQILILSVFSLFAHSALASDLLDKIISLDISENARLEDALIDWGTQAGVTVMINTRSVDDQRTHGLHGKFRARDALSELLRNSGLIYTEDGGRIRVISKSPLVSSSLGGAQQVERLASKDDTYTTPNVLNAGLTSDSVSGIQEVVVTAERREENLEQVPISISAFNQQTLDDLRVQSLADLATITPGLVIPPPGAGGQSLTNIVIRGVSTSNNAPTTGVYIDDTAISLRQIVSGGYSSTPQPDMFDLERVEVLRGPQGTLFGSSTMGGAIRFITPQPSLQTPSGYAKAEVGFTERGAPSYATGAAYGAPITQGTSGFRVSAYYHSDGGFIDIEDPYTGQILNRNANSSHTIVLRPAFTVAPTEEFTITPAVFIQRKSSSAPGQIWFTGLPTPARDAFASGFGVNVPQPVQDNLTIASIALRHTVGGVTLSSDTSYLDRTYRDLDDYSNIVLALFGAGSINTDLSAFSAYDQNVSRTRAWQQEFRATSQAMNGRLVWVAGAYYRHALDDLTQYVGPDFSPLTEYIGAGTVEDAFGVPNYVVNGQAYASYSVSSTVSEEFALFSDITLELFRGFKTSVGVRGSRSAVKDQSQFLAGPLDGTAAATVHLPDAVEHPVTPKFSFTYQFSDDEMAYFTAAKGFRNGGSNSPDTVSNPQCVPSAQALGLTAVPEAFKSDSLWSYEVGAKGDFFNRRLSIQSSIFYISWDNIQTSVGLPSCSQNFDTNRGRAIIQGFDLQLAAVLAEGLKFSGNVGYTHGYYPNAMYGAPDPNTGQAPLLNGAGEQLTFVPPWTASAVLEYSVGIAPLWEGARSYLRIDDRWQSAGVKPNPDLPNYDPDTGLYPDESYNLLNFRVGVLHSGLDLSVFGDNLTNANPRLGRTHAVPGDPLFYGVALRPRTFGLTAIYRF